jgi:ABC-type Na+ efflux pump permease subunit
MITRAIIAVTAAFLFALSVGILTANLAESGNDRASSPTIGTLALQY